jgi:hypothetical protein
MPPSGALPAAALWVQGVLTGPAATGLATLAIAGTGFALLTGRIDWRRGLQVVLGCFLLFGAPLLVRELAGVVRGESAVVALPESTAALPLPSAPKPPPQPDPYAGASVPM